MLNVVQNSWIWKLNIFKDKRTAEKSCSKLYTLERDSLGKNKQGAKSYDTFFVMFSFMWCFPPPPSKLLNIIQSMDGSFGINISKMKRRGWLEILNHFSWRWFYQGNGGAATTCKIWEESSATTIYLRNLRKVPNLPKPTIGPKSKFIN